MSRNTGSIQLISQEGDIFEISFSLIHLSDLIHSLILNEKNEEDYENSPQEIPLTNIKSSILALILQFVEYYSKDPMREIAKPLISTQMSDVVQEWYANYINIDQETLFELIEASNFLMIKPLLDLTCATVASMIKGKTPEEIRKHFNIVNDFTPAEEAQVREENKWCEEA